jgi:hypothetical protein
MGSPEVLEQNKQKKNRGRSVSAGSRGARRRREQAV